MRSPDPAPSAAPGPPPAAPPPPRKLGSSGTAIAVTLGSALVVATCSTSREHGAVPVTPVASVTSGPASAPTVAVAAVENAAPPIPTEIPAAPAPEPAAPLPAAPPQRVAGHELDRFFAALRTLEKHARKSHVRVAWLGDSHGASDLWSGPLRAALQARFGNGGLGFVHVGYKAYRHDGVKLEAKGRWAVEPRAPSTAVRTGTGVFGLGGVVYVGTSEGPHEALTVNDPNLPTTLQWDLCYRFDSPHDEIAVDVTGLPNRILKADANAAGQPRGLLHHVSFTSSAASPTLRVVPTGGSPGFCGVIVETDPAAQPGVVLDTLGINGARLTTPLAWDEAAWVAELSRRPPSLTILEYGTNESGDHTIRTETYVDNLRKLMARVRAAAPESDCLVLAPTDRADTEERTPLVRDALREAARVSGCGFWDTYAVMGGKGSITAWHAETPPRSGPDGVHLTIRGYKYLGEHLAADVLESYPP